MSAESSPANSINGGKGTNNRGKLPRPKSIRRWKRSAQKEPTDDEPNRSRGRTALSQQTTATGDDSLLNMVDEEDASGRSDDDLLPSRPKGLSTHPSQIGYLTTSSPLVQANHLQDIRTPDDDAEDPFARASTLPPETTDSDTLGYTLPLSSSKTGLAPPSSKSRRSTSPAGRFRSVFKSKKSPAASIASTDSHSPERQRPVDLIRADTAEESSKSSNSPASSLQTTSFPSITVADSSTSATPPSSSHSVAGASQHQPGTSKTAPNERFRRVSRGQKVDTTARPETPPSDEKATPVIVNTPPTPTDPSHLNTIVRPRTAVTASPDAVSYSPVGHSNGSSPASVNHSIIAQRRSRAGSASLVPSKLSNFTLAPLTPTPESGAVTPSASGFFSSVLSAAQNATNSLSNATNSFGSTIASTNLTAPWSNSSKKTGGKDQDDKTGSSLTVSTEGTGEDHDDEVEVESLGAPLVPSVSSSSKEPAVKTLGMGDLSLSQLGIADQPKNNGSLGGSSAANSANISAMANSPILHAQRVAEVSSESRHRSESAPADSSHFHAPSDYTDHGSDAGHSGRPGSVSDFAHDDRTPPTASLYGDKEPKEPAAVQRTGSIRSAIGRRRNRGSSAVSGGTIAAAIAAANASVAHPAHAGSTPKLTGFAVASKKRNRDFHNFFKSVPDDDYLIEDYSCALQREILAHGRLYVSEGHLCFSSNILGWVTTLVMSFDEIVSVEKRSTALVFKNGLMISTLHAKHIFASFASRDSTYDLIVKIWKLGHPSLQSSLNGVRIDETGGDKTEKIDEGDEGASAGSRSESDSGDDSDDDSNDVYDEDAEDDDAHDVAQAAEANGGAADADAERTVARKVSGTAAAAAANGAGGDKPKDAPAAAGGADYPGPTTHAVTDCGNADAHYDKGLIDEVIPAPLGKVFSYIFGGASATFMPKWLSNDQKCFDIQMQDKKGLGTDNKSRTFSYIKPLNASIGPKQTKCIVTEQVEALDFDKAIHIVCSTQNPDVPSGNVFTVKTNYCLSWAEGNGTRMQMTCTTEWSGKSWLRVPIEKAANEGQAQYGRDLLAGLKEAVATRSRAGTATNGAANGAKGGKAGKKGRKGKAGALASGPTSDSERSKPKPSAKSDWGVLEPVHGILGPAVDIVKPLLTGNVMYGLLVGLLVASWFRFGSNGNNSGGVGGGASRRGAGYPDRLVAYEEMWQREESELWDWLEERVGLDRLMDNGGVVSGAAVGHGSGGGRGGSTKGGDAARKRTVEPRTVEEKLREERMDDREIREAIRVTEEKLQVLKEVVDKRERMSE
ncbi:GRAM domain protein [Sporothrix schenckii 1099-18]|uniref:VASt domain-containing protein n=2 Tax=Sporothrix schenckii TaxID=29908 RepID=U7Q3U8_SPOS1|nr:GRAM domain protein [Sporothrix schenckii 1099-18]ERT02559.1 hypothetical protein HMPREF1624_00859 [Sporothrix schenckii ATCC 58251]KJR80150.1 GRAM domain protein [Sporothrix schenckii 1099-18]